MKNRVRPAVYSAFRTRHSALSPIPHFPLSTADERHDFETIAWRDAKLVMLRARDQLEIDFDGNVLRSQFKRVEQIGDCRAIGELALGAVECDVQAGSVSGQWLMISECMLIRLGYLLPLRIPVTQRRGSPECGRGSCREE
jgi:hypothetical protein